jgi:hypothetical protein
MSERVQLCREIRAHLEGRGAALRDEQLPALLESRREVLQLLEQSDATLVEAFTAAAVRWDDAAALSLIAKAQRVLQES